MALFLTKPGQETRQLMSIELTWDPTASSGIVLKGVKEKIWKREFVDLFILLFREEQRGRGQNTKTRTISYRPKLPQTLEN